MRSLHIFCILCKDDAVFIPTNITFHRALKNLMPYAQNIKKICINVWCPIYTHFLCHHYPCTVGQNSIFCPLIEFVSKCEFCLILNVSPKMSHNEKCLKKCLADVSLMSHLKISHLKCLTKAKMSLSKCLTKNASLMSR